MIGLNLGHMSRRKPDSRITPVSSCADQLVDISALLDGELSSIKAASLEDHMRECPNCTALYEQFKSLHELFEKMFEAEPVEASKRVKELLFNSDKE